MVKEKRLSVSHICAFSGKIIDTGFHYKNIRVTQIKRKARHPEFAELLLSGGVEGKRWSREQRFTAAA